jgi:hypothetical protein
MRSALSACAAADRRLSVDRPRRNQHPHWIRGFLLVSTPPDGYHKGKSLTSREFLCMTQTVTGNVSRSFWPSGYGVFQ